jgi:hypothetical protein
MCGQHRRGEARWVGDNDLRASQDERDRVVERLRTHAGEGRLELDELEERVESALRARTRGELAALMSDLPRLSGRERSRGQRAVARASAAMALLPLLLAIVLFSAAPPMIAWMGWPILGFWFFAGLPASSLGFAWCGWSRRRRRRTVIV